MDIFLVGATGSMGETITEVVNENENFNIVAGFGKINTKNNGYPIYSDFSLVKEDFDVILDFSYHNLIDDILDFAVIKNRPIVIATTGYNDEQIKKIQQISNKIPILFSGNMSVGINLLLNIVENLSKSLPEFDIEIIEKHHNLKKDSPSGTAKMLYNSANIGRENSLFEVDGRSGNNLERNKKEVGLHSVRGGTIVGEHTVIFSGLDEVIDVSHIAQSKKIFANGGLTACKFIANKKFGLYSMKDIFEF